jgi:hypothetical protein
VVEDDRPALRAVVRPGLPALDADRDVVRQLHVLAQLAEDERHLGRLEQRDEDLLVVVVRRREDDDELAVRLR